MKAFSVSKLSDGLTRSVESGHKNSRRKKKTESDHEEIEEIKKKKIRFNFNISVENPNPPKDKTKERLAPALRFSEKVKKQTSCAEYLRLLKFLHDYGTAKITKVHLKRMVVDYFPDFIDDFIDVLNLYEDNPSTPPPPKPDKGFRTSSITPSYYYNKENLQGAVQSSSSGIDEVGKEVLNFSCFSKGCCYDDSKVVRHRDRNEKKLNAKEDKLFVKDMLKAWKESTEKNARELLKEIEKKKEEIIEKTIDVNEYLTGYNFRFIKNMYGDEGLNIVDHLGRSPQTVLPVIIKRLQQL